MNENEKVDDFNERFVSVLNRIPIKPVEIVQIEYYTSTLLPNIAMFVKTQRKLTLADNFAEAIQVEKDFETMFSCLGEEEDLTESDFANLKRNKAEGKKHVKKKISTNTSLNVPPTPKINLEDYSLDNFCCTHGAYHSEKTCPEFLNSFYALLLPPETHEKKNNDVEEENYEDEERELKEAEHPPNLILDQDETELDNMDVDGMEEENHKDEESEVEELIESNHPPSLILDQDEAEMDDTEDCIEIDSYLLSKEDHSTSNPTTIASTITETTIGEFLEKDEQIEKDSTPNPMANGLSNPDKLVISLNFIIDNSCFETFFGRSNAELSSFANSYKQSELLPCNQIADPNHINSWTLYFEISRNEHGADAGYLLIDPCGKKTYLVIHLEPGYIDTIAETETLIQGLRKAINMNVMHIEVFGGFQKVIK